MKRYLQISTIALLAALLAGGFALTVQAQDQPGGPGGAVTEPDRGGGSPADRSASPGGSMGSETGKSEPGTPSAPGPQGAPGPAGPEGPAGSASPSGGSSVFGLDPTAAMFLGLVIVAVVIIAIVAVSRNGERNTRISTR